MSIQTVGLPAGKVLTVTAGESDCTLFRILDTGLPGTPTAVSSGGTSAVGPFGEARTYGIDSITNQATYAITAQDPQNATTLASSFVEQGADNALDDGVDISVGTTTGTKIGTATGQKLAFHNSTPVIQRASANQTAVTDNTGGSVADAIAAVVTAPTALTDSTGGAASATLAAITNSANAGSADVAPVADALASLAARQAEDLAAIVALTNGLAKTIELANELRAALVEKGLIKGAA